MNRDPILTQQNRSLAFAEFDRMGPDEFVKITRIIDTHQEVPVPAPFADGSDIMDDICRYTSDLPTRDLPKALQVFRALSSSSKPSDRAHISFFIDSLTAVEECREEALDMWDKLLRDADNAVRESALMYFEGCLNQHTAGYEGFEAVAMSNEEALILQTGLSRDQAEKLMLAYAYAENGHDLHYVGIGRCALSGPEER